VRRTLPALIALLLVPLAPACDGGGGRSGVDPCDTPQAPLLGCEPPAARTELPTVEDACRRLVGCGFLPVNDPNDSGYHYGDYLACLNFFASDEFSPDRLAFTLRCIEVSTCLDLRAGFDSPCFLFGDPEP